MFVSIMVPKPGWHAGFLCKVLVLMVWLSDCHGQQGTARLKKPGQTTPHSDADMIDVIFSGGGSGCKEDDEDDCSQPTDNDVLIKPTVAIKVKPTQKVPVHTRPPPTTQSTEQLKSPSPIPRGSGDGGGPCSGGNDDDDDDCENSGVDPVQTPETTTDDFYLLLTSPHDNAYKHTPSPVNQPNVRSTTSSIEVFSVNLTESTPRVTKKSMITTTKIPSYAIHDSTTDGKNRHNNGQGGNIDQTHDHGETKQPQSIGINIGIILGIVIGVIIILLIAACILYKYKGREDHAYKVDERKSYACEPAPIKPPMATNGGLNKTNCSSSKTRKKDVKEWYV